MKKLLRKITRGIAKNNLFWKLVKPFIKAANYVQVQRNITTLDVQYAKNHQKFASLLKTPEIKNGPFKGLKYPNFDSFNNIFSKILGSYEFEISPLVERICQKDYSEILDIGAGEGYYAIGFATRIPGAKVYAYDINETANALCREIARLNNVESQVEIKQACSPEILENFNFTKKCLIKCDVDGYERELFNESNLKNISQCDLLIETHDLIDINITSYIEKLFNKTHNMQVIQSVDDIIKAKTYPFKEIEGLDLNEKKSILREGRSSIQEWYYLEPKNDSTIMDLASGENKVSKF